MRSQSKDVAFHSIALVERMARGLDGGRPSLDPAELKKIRNFILPLFDPWLGSAVHETPLVDALRAAAPDVRIVAVAGGLAQQVFQNHPGLEMVSNTPDPNRHLGLAVRRIREVVQSFRGEPWCALFTAWNCRSRVALAAMLAGNGVRAGFTVAPPLLHLPISFDRDLSQIANNLRIPELLGHSVPDGLEPRVYFSSSDMEHALNLLGGDTSRPIAVLITRTSGGQPKAWPEDRFLAVARHLIAAHDCRILFPGTAADAASLTQLTDLLGHHAQSLAGKTSISQLAAVCAMSDLAISLDTGGVHVARSQALPLVVIAPGWQDSVEWMPVGKPWARILRGPLFSPPPPANYVIEEVTVDDVIAAAEDLLREFSPSPAARAQRVKRSLGTSSLSV